MKTSNKKAHICFLIFVTFILALPTVSYADVKSFSATLIDFDGNVFIHKEKSDEWLDVMINMPIQKEDNIITGEASYAEIFIDDGSTIKVEESSEINLRELVFDEYTYEVEIEIFLKAGILLSNIVEAIQRSPSVKVYTNTAVAGVRGTEFVVDASDPEETNIGVFSGEVDAFSLDEDGNVLEDEPVFIEEGYQTTVLRNNVPARPFLHKKRMHALRIRAVQRRKDIPAIIQKRKMIKRRIIMPGRRIINNKPPPPGTSQGTPTGPRPPVRRPAPP
ncbi:MAG: FecR domain-containing protein [Deltaproteobacteria bacterium]|nr:FecR domain-containing protein [Deltaproteobacteria bacterium]